MVLFELQITCKSGLHIGAGKSADLAGSDLPVVRDASGRPFVPGSSLRGVLRGGIEAISRSLDLDRALGCTGPRPPAPQQERLTIEEDWRSWDLADRLFGRVALRSGDRSYASRLQISDLVLQTDGEPLGIELRDGVAIDRETRTASDSKKFDQEVVPAGTRFRGRVRLKNPADYEIGLLAQGLWMFDQGLLLLGGKSSRGLGWVGIETTSPIELSARQILARAAAPVASDLGPIETQFGRYLSGLAELVEAARSAPDESPDFHKEAV
jgi:CRISPR-associated RAMP protein (TIGR02581 family)